MTDNEDKKEEEGASFDMYHFFSRKDVILVALLIVVFLIFMLFKAFTGTSVI